MGMISLVDMGMICLVDIRLVFPDPPRLFGYRQKNHEKINSSRKNRLKKSMTRRYPKRRGGSGNTSLTSMVEVSALYVISNGV